jgi:hypothetical protein
VPHGCAAGRAPAGVQLGLVGGLSLLNSVMMSEMALTIAAISSPVR